MPAEDICEIRFMLGKECNAHASICSWPMMSMISVTTYPSDVYVSLLICTLPRYSGNDAYVGSDPPK